MAPGAFKKKAGIVLLCYSFIPLVTVAAVPFLPLPASWRASFAGLYVLSGELAFLLSVLLLGKPFVEGVKQRIRQWFFPKKAPAPPRPVGKGRHYAGVALFFLSFLPYFASEALLLLGAATDTTLRWIVAGLLGGDVLFIASLVVLGPQFWAGLKALFVWTPPQEDRPA